MEPPPCVQNAMMKQDKKPFTYTPGGIDLSEIKSPRMARRIERNANYSGAPESPRPLAQQPPLGPLPPSALAAMQPQMHVQVFPSGPPPPPGPRAGAPPPPPPPPANMPPPPPPPSEPLPTQKLVTTENQVVERPDMTRIIPDNPMALLRKTGGPQPRKTLVDEMYNTQSMKTPPVMQQPLKSPPIQPSQRWAPQPPQVQQQARPPQQNHQQSPPVQQWSPPLQQEPQRYQPKVIERNQEPEEQAVKTSTAHLGSLYIPPINQQQQRGVASPPSPPKRDPQSPQLQSPSTPTLKEAPRPWQKQQKQQEELPPWAKKESPPIQQERVQQPPPQRFAPQRFAPAQQQTNQRPPSPQSTPNAVYVTQPLVFQHPGPPPNGQQQQPKPRVDAQGNIVIPIQVEGARKAPTKPATPVTPGNERSLNRQQSWNNNPTQSNAFKVIQKITQTDGDDEDDNAPVIEHGPRYPQQFQQTPPVEQMRKLKLSEGDRELMNRFRQGRVADGNEIVVKEEEDPRYRGGLIPSRVFRILDESGVDDDTSLHNEVDPRYRGPAIPSKAFKLLQSMTDGSSDIPTPGATVSRGPPAGNRTPQVRNIPIQIERDDQPRNYVHPSEQTVPEPKKYTGSSIPSRSFKMLQAMTAPDSCANANEVNENYDPSSYNQWGYDPNYPPPVPPYWPDYYYNYYYQNSKESDNDRDIRQTPVPFWGYYPSPSPYPFVQRPLRTPDVESEAETPRNTPLPFWGYYPAYYPPPTPTRELEEWGCYPPDGREDPNNFAPPYQYPPYWDPYYYYYGYPPMYSPYPFYEANEGEEFAGYSSTDEMAYFSRKIKDERGAVQEERSKTPKVLVTPTLPQEFAQKKEGGAEIESERDSSESDSETEVETEEEQTQPKRSQSSGGLQAIRSVKDISVYDNDEDQNCSDEDQNTEENSEENEDSVSYIIEEDTIPHQLSVIFEESERSDSKRESSVLSDSTTIADKSDDEEDEENSTAVSVKLPLKFKVEVTDNEEVTTVTVGESEIKIGEEEEEEETGQDGGKEPFASFAAKSSPPAAVEEKVETEAVIYTSDDEKKSIPNEDNKEKEEEEELDWWGILNKEDDVMPVKTKPVVEEEAVAPAQQEVQQTTEEKEKTDDDDAGSTSSSDSSSSESSSASKKETVEEESSSESEEESDSDSDNESEGSDVNNNAKAENVENPEPLSIKERIQALKDSINMKRERLKDDGEINKMSVKEKVSAIEAGALQNNSKTTSTKSSVKSFEEFSEEEGDSGVTSDMSRHISDNEEFPELKKMTRYQRAATHSRLFKLLQEVCEEEDEKEREEEKKEAQDCNKEETAVRRDQLSLPLKNVSDESFSSSGITSPGSPVSEKLVSELVQSILKRKKGQIFRNMPKEKLQAAAKRILQEELDEMSTPDSSFLSPLRNGTESSTPAQTPQEFYNDYKQYYDSWSDAERLCDENYDIIPSKAFKLLQEHSGLNRTGAIAGLLAKCPKILSAKNVHQELMKLIESSPESPSSSLEPGEVTSFKAHWSRNLSEWPVARNRFLDGPIRLHDMIMILEFQ
ncbi:titin-like [Asbolus verrucosus]|uniref:Titin-like n=1 Tax=Asbolus verrucosus TaxID=1661398 RepID=A0A482VHG8_ASBVE|nr:titin-like [Asbolus verrucosus]